MKEKVPIYQKQNLTLEEAAEYSNIGINVGNKRLIKRKLFDEFIENINMI